MQTIAQAVAAAKARQNRRPTASPTPPVSGPGQAKKAEPKEKPYTSASDWAGPDDCQVCGAPPEVLGYVRRDVPFGHQDFGQIFPCPACHAGKLARRLQKKCQLPGWLQAATFDSYRLNDGNQDGYQAARHFAGESTGWLTLWGSYGTGKTHLLAAIVNHCVKNDRAAVYYTLPELLDQLRDSFNRDGFSNTLSRLVRLPVLVVDEVDKANWTNWAGEAVHELVDARYRMMDQQGTVFAMNSQPEIDCSDRGYLYSRMHDGRNRVVQVGGGDVRPLVMGGERP